MQKDSAQAKISLKVVGGLLFLTHPVDGYKDVFYELCHLTRIARTFPITTASAERSFSAL